MEPSDLPSTDESNRLRAENEQLQERLTAAEANGNKALEEMQQFAYAASHDLQEPLRTIASYAQLLERRYGGDAEASEYTSYIVEGVARLNTLISDLLTYSRVASPVNAKRTPVKLSQILQWVLFNQDTVLREANATVTHGELPEVVANESQMVQLLQHLIANGVKFRGEQTPKIHVESEEAPDGMIVTVRDNGIGIDPQYGEQVFGVFKRLHGRDVPGTGIGLAVCRKIMESHGGKIWVESDGKTGSAFRLLFPY